MVRKMVPKNRIQTFIWGTLCGVTLSVLLLSLGGWWVIRNGVTVYLDSNDIAATVGAQVTSYARNDLPKMIDAAKAEIPSIVKNEMDGQLSERKMEIAGFAFSMPDELVLQLESYFQSNVEKSVYRLLDGLDTSQLSKDIGKTASLLVAEQMREQLHGETFSIPIMGPFELPVTVFIRN